MQNNNTRITLGVLRLEGFRSYVTPTVFKLSVGGLHLITGPNGVGKSSLFAGIAWVLYKLNLSGTKAAAVQTWDWKRTKEWQGTRGIVEFIKGDYKYLVARHIGYKGKTLGTTGGNDLRIYRKPVINTDKWDDSHQLSEPLYKADAQEFLTKLIGIDEYTFTNSILFGQKMARLISADAKDKRKLFETLFDLDFVEAAKEKAALRRSVIMMQTGKDRATHAATLVNVDNLTQQQTTAQRLLDSFEENKRVIVQGMDRDIASAEQEQGEVFAMLLQKRREQDIEIANVDTSGPSQGDLYQAVQMERSTLSIHHGSLHAKQREKGNYSGELQTIDRKVKKLWEDLKGIVDKCPTCGSKIAAGKVNEAKEAIEARIKVEVAESRKVEAFIVTLDKEILEIEKDIVTGNSRVARLDKEYQAMVTADSILAKSGVGAEITRLEQRGAVLSERLAYTQAAREKELAKQPPAVDMAGILARIAEAWVIVKELEITIAKHDKELWAVEWWMQKALGANGLKANVFSAMLTKLNQLVAKYEPFIGYRVRFSVDMSKESRPFVTTCYLDDMELDYNDLSGGQKQRTDVCLAFAMQDLVSSKANINVLLLDEIFESLDREGTAMVVELLQEKAKDAAVYVVTHNQMMDIYGANVITVGGGNEDGSVLTA